MSNPLVYGDLSWTELLHKISILAIKQKTIGFSEEILEKGNLNRPPATKEQIIATENQLNLKLPDDYKEFLLTSNGFESFSQIGVTLATVDKVNFLINVDQVLVDIWASGMDDVNPGFSEKLKNSIIIGRQYEEQQLLLVPLQENNWECWHFANWNPGEVVYQSFRSYMEHELQKLEDNFYED